VLIIFNAASQDKSARDEKIIGRFTYVFYSVSTEIKKQAQLKIIRTNLKSQLFKEIFTNLFLRGIIDKNRGDVPATHSSEEQ
jgi:hypothetical protein